MTLQVAVRSNEPYRLQCYGFLSAVASIGGLGEHLGCSTSPQLQCFTLAHSSAKAQP